MVTSLMAMLLSVAAAAEEEKGRVFGDGVENVGHGDGGFERMDGGDGRLKVGVVADRRGVLLESHIVYILAGLSPTILTVFIRQVAG